MTWWYAKLGDGTRYIPEVRPRPDGTPMKTREKVALTARQRWDVDASYRPPNLGAYLARNGPIVPV